MSRARASVNAWLCGVLTATLLHGCDGDEARGDAGVGGARDGGARDGGATVRPLERCASGAPANRGLVERGRWRQPPSFTGQNAGHLCEVTPVGGGVALVANAQDSFASLRLGAGGDVTELAAIPAGIEARRLVMCTTLAHHGPSRTVYCGYGQSDEGTLATFDLRDAADPRLRDAAALRDPRLRVRRLRVIGDTLYLAAFDAGLLAASIGPDGALSNLRETGVSGDVRQVDGDGGRIAVLDHSQGLRVLRPAGGRWSLSAPLPLEGPRLGLRVVGDTALVALGSEGVAVVDLAADPPRETLRLRPPGVATAVDRAGDLVAVACTAGVFVYDLAGSSPRLRGWYPAQAIVLDVRFDGGDLVVADWETVARLALNPAERMDAIEVGWGQLVGAGAAGVSLRNLGEVPATLTLQWAWGAGLGQVSLGAGETRAAPIDFSALGMAREDLSVNVLLGDDASDDCVVGRATFARSSGRAPGVGDAMPPLVLATSPTTALRVPLAGEATRVVFYSHDCAAVWPQLEDLAHLARVGRLPDGATPVMVAREREARFGFARRFGLEGLRAAYYGGPLDPVPDEVRASVAPYGNDLYYGAFQVNELRGGAAHPTDYIVSREGRVIAVERIYRGAFTLR